MSSRRRQARECALQMLYQIELAGDPIEQVVARYWEANDVTEEVHRFAEALAVGVNQNGAALDEMIMRFSTNWKLSRMAAVDRNILRLAVYELVHCDDIPAKVTINEAVEIAKRFGTIESGSFVNGILDNVARATSASEPKTEAGSEPKEEDAS